MKHLMSQNYKISFCGIVCYPENLTVIEECECNKCLIELIKHPDPCLRKKDALYRKKQLYDNDFDELLK